MADYGAEDVVVGDGDFLAEDRPFGEDDGVGQGEEVGEGAGGVGGGLGAEATRDGANRDNALIAAASSGARR